MAYLFKKSSLLIFAIITIFQTNLFSQEIPLFIDTFEDYSYSSSWGYYSEPSNLELVWSRIPISKKFSHSGNSSLKLHWQSQNGGEWAIAIASVGWENHDITNQDSLVFWVYSQKEITTKHLPKIYLEDVSYKKTEKIDLTQFVDTIQVNKWNRVILPIELFKQNNNGIDLTKIRSVFFGQGNSDNTEHELFIDDIKIINNKIINGDLSPVVVVLGSSTAEGVGANPKDSSWVNKYRNYLQTIDSTYEVVNLGVGGYTSYQLMPSNILPQINRPFPIVTKNLTYALSFNPTSIIVNLPSNDVALKYTIEEQFNNYFELKNITDSLNIPLWFCTTQPRNFDSLDITQQVVARDNFYKYFPGKVIDFWNGIANVDGRIKKYFDSGDGVHVNNKGHNLLFEKVRDSKVLQDYIPTEYLAINKQKSKSKIDSLLLVMTIDEKVGQLVQIVGVNSVEENWINKGHVGSYLGNHELNEANRLQKIAVDSSRLGVPLLFANDVIHGYKTTFPIPLAETSSWNPELVKSASEIAAFEAASNGTHWTYAPMVDITRDPRWGRVMEGSGEDPYLGSIMANARINGFQGKSLVDKNTVAACAKHFVGYGGALAGKDYNTVDVSERMLHELYLPPFYQSVKSGVATMMSSFNDISGIPASANHFTLTEILKNEWNFNGFVISDYNSIGELINHGIAKDKKEAALKGFTAGVDVDMVGGDAPVPIENVYHPWLEKLVDEGKVSMMQLNNSVRRVLKLKQKLGLFDNPYFDSNYYRESSPSKVYKDSIAKQLAKESVVLLKNSKSVLPLSKNLNSIALIGPLAKDKSNLLGGWSALGKAENVISVFDGLSDKMNDGTEILYSKGCGIDDENKEGFSEAREIAKKADVAIIIVGESRNMSAEAASRTSLSLPGIQEKLILEIAKTKTPIIVIVMNGRPLTLGSIYENPNVNSILETWYLGDQTGGAIADILFGDYNPSGKLPITFPRSIGQIPIYYNHKSTGRPPTEEKYTSKYIDSPVTPLFPFGYGLSYTEFTYNNISVSSDSISVGDNLTVSTELVNAGIYEGEEVVQLYIRDVVASITRPIKELKGFKKIKLKPNEKRNIQFEITSDMLEFYDINMNKIVEDGEFEIMIGGNSQELHKISFIVTN